MSDERSTALDSPQSSPVTPVSVSSFGAQHGSDSESLATTVEETVMAEQVTKDAVKEAQSAARLAPVDDTASTNSTPAVNGELPSGPKTTTSAPFDHSSTTTSAPSAGDGARAPGKADGAAREVRSGREGT